MADGSVLLITGASSGIGAETARAAVEAGWRVVLGARSEDKLGDLAESLGGEKQAVHARCDVTEWEDQQALVAHALDRFGRLDAAFANAGFGAQRGFLEETPEHWRAMVDTNVYGAALTIRASLPHFRDAGSGHFLLTGSVAGRIAIPGSLYSSTKWAVTGMAQSLRAELSADETTAAVRVTLIAPGIVDTPFFESRPSGALEPQDVARAVLYVLSQPPHVDVNEILVRPVSQPL